MRRSEAKHNAGQPTPPRWHPSGARRLLPPPTPLPFAVVSRHPTPVDLDCLCNECEVLQRCITGHCEPIGESFRPSGCAFRSADHHRVAGFRPSCPAALVDEEGHVERLFFHLEQRRKRRRPSVKVSSGFQDSHPHKSSVGFRSDPQFHEVFCLVQGFGLPS